jgi:hypothetical protein
MFVFANFSYLLPETCRVSYTNYIGLPISTTKYGAVIHYLIVKKNQAILHDITQCFFFSFPTNSVPVISVLGLIMLKQCPSFSLQ